MSKSFLDMSRAERNQKFKEEQKKEQDRDRRLIIFREELSDIISEFAV